MTKLSKNQFYCLKCKDRVSVKASNVTHKTVKNSKIKGGVLQARAVCPSCDTQMCKFVSK